MKFKHFGAAVVDDFPDAEADADADPDAVVVEVEVVVVVVSVVVEVELVVEDVEEEVNKLEKVSPDSELVVDASDFGVDK